MLRKKTNTVHSRRAPEGLLARAAQRSVDRRTFLRTSGLALGGIAAMGAVGGTVTRADAQAAAAAGVKSLRTVCTHCSVGCSIIAEVQNGVWVRQQPSWDNPFNMGGHCAKGAAIRELAHGERRLKYPTKLVNGEWTRISWDQAIQEVGDKILQIREESGPDAVHWIGSAKFSNEQAYLFRKFVAYMGSNNTDHQARICHSTTVAGVANTWGYGAMTNSYNDMVNSKAIFLIGGNPAEAHPVSLLHILRAKEINNCQLIVADPRFTRTAAHANEFIRFRPGTDVALVYGLIWHITQNGWDDKEFLRTRVWGWDKVMAEVARWTPAEVERVTGVPGSQMERVARTMANNRPGTVVWCMGVTQHTTGNNNTRALCHLQLALGNMGKAGGGTNIFRGHDNVQGASDFGLFPDSLMGYYGVTPGAWRHWARVWEEDFDWLNARFDKLEGAGPDGATVDMMYQGGIPVSRWIDGVLEDAENLDQRSNIRAEIFWGHAPNSLTRQVEMREAMSKLDLLVVIDPHPTVTAVLQNRQDGVYLLPTTTQMENYGSVTASNRSLQWREKVVEPLFEAKTDHVIIKLFADKFGISDRLFRNIAVNGDEPLIEDITREFNRGMWTIGYTGQSPERLKLHMENMHTFDRTTLRAVGGPCDGDYYGMPWPCWGTADVKHPGSPNLYDLTKHVMDGGMGFRTRFGVEREGQSLLADGVYPVGSEIQDGYPEFTMQMLMDLGWDGDLTADELATIQRVAGNGDIGAVSWTTDLSGGIQRVALAHGCCPYGNAKARAEVWTFPDPIPVHREPLYSNRRDLVADYPTYQDRKFWRVPTLYETVQKQDFSQDYPIILTSGRLVEYEGGGDETRSNPWLAELQQNMFIEINPRDANNYGVRDGAQVWVEGPEGGKVKVMAMVTERVAPGVAFMPFHFGGHFQGVDERARYPKGADPYVLGEACNTAQTYGYDSVTQMQETKATLCKIWAA